MAVSRRKKLLREKKLSIYSSELKRAKKFASTATPQEFKTYVPSRKYVRTPESTPSLSQFKLFHQLTAKREKQEYTGDYITGLATMHKSNIVPVCKDDNPVDYATMRRN